MESKNIRKRKQQDMVDSNPEQNEDVEMMGEETTSIDSQQRKIIKPKKRLQQQQDKIIEEDGEEIELGSEQEYEQEDVVQNDDSDQWEDESEQEEVEPDTDMKEETKKDKKVTFGKVEKKEIWDESKEPIKEGEELVFDNSAYEMLHRAKVEWPSLSIDFLLKDRIGTTDMKSYFPQYLHTLDPQMEVKDKRGFIKHKNDKFPYTVYLCAGSQALKKNENKIYVMKWSQMKKTLKEESESESESEEENESDPIMRFETIPHRGCVNRIRSMYGTGIVATWNDEAEVGIYDVSTAIDALDQPIQQDKKKKEKQTFGGTKISSFKNKTEGFALDWSNLTFGRLAAGCCNSQIYLYQAADESCSSFVKENQLGLQGHHGSVEDVQFSPAQEHVLASCSTDQTIKLWDLRATQYKAQMSYKAHDCDVNVISWNSTTKFLLASGDDKGEFKIWDLRMLQQSTIKGIEPITQIRWHTAPITSLQFEPREDSVLAVSSADNKLTLWDFSVEVDESTKQEQEEDIPPQLLFLHQGQNNIKELRFHPYYRTMIVTTAEDSFNIFRPNLEPDEDQLQEEEIKDTKMKSAQYYVDSEDEELEEQRAINAVKNISKNRKNKSQQKDGKRRKFL